MLFVGCVEVDVYKFFVVVCEYVVIGECWVVLNNVLFVSEVDGF